MRIEKGNDATAGFLGRRLAVSVLEMRFSLWPASGYTLMSRSTSTTVTTRSSRPAALAPSGTLLAAIAAHDRVVADQPPLGVLGTAAIVDAAVRKPRPRASAST
jgi:hypothetical protein